MNFSDAEELIDDKQLQEPVNPAIAKEAALNDRKQKKEIRNLEQELPKWQVLVESVTGVCAGDITTILFIETLSRS